MKDLDYISEYFLGTPAPDAVKQFDQKIQEDPVFAEEVAFYCSSFSMIKDQLVEEKKKRFREIYKAEEVVEENKTPVIYMRRWLKVAAVAAAVIIIFIAGWLWWPQPTAKELADKYIKENFSELPVTMGSEDSLQVGKDLYNNRKLTESLNQFEAILKKDTGNTEAKKYAGIVSLKLKLYDKALDYFKQLENSKLFSNPGKFYHSLTLIERNNPNDKQEARLLLEQVVNYDLEGREKAADWLKKW